MNTTDRPRPIVGLFIWGIPPTASTSTGATDSSMVTPPSPDAPKDHGWEMHLAAQTRPLTSTTTAG
jgi:hypothetical protein